MDPQRPTPRACDRITHPAGRSSIAAGAVAHRSTCGIEPRSARGDLLSATGALSLLIGAVGALFLLVGACDENKTPSGSLDAGLNDDAGHGECGVAEVGVWSRQQRDQGAGAGQNLAEINLFGVWGFEREDDLGQKTTSVWAAGSHGRVLRIDEGDLWTVMQTPADVQLTSIWGTSDKNVWVAGFGGVVLQYDGTQWNDRTPPYQRFLRADGGVLGPDAAAAKQSNLWGIWVAGRDEETEAVFVVGDRGTLLLWQADVWSRVDTGQVEEDLSAIWGANAANVFVVGDFGTVLRGSAAGFQRQQTGIARALRGVWGRGASEVYAVGVEGTVLRFDGSEWKRVEGAPRQVLRDVWGPANDRSTAYIVGWDGALIRMGGGPSFRRGAVFDVIGCVTQNRLEGIWGQLVEVPAPQPDAGLDGGAADAGTIRVPSVWAVGVSGTVVTGPRADEP